jgi:hypothetical protein
MLSQNKEFINIARYALRRKGRGSSALSFSFLIPLFFPYLNKQGAKYEPQQTKNRAVSYPCGRNRIKSGSPVKRAHVEKPCALFIAWTFLFMNCL